jgi:hypothetical protein
MNYLGIDNIRILKDSQDEISVNTFTKKDLENSPIRYFSLNSPYELAKFKYIMEEYIIPFEKKKHANNGFLKRFVKTSYLNYNLNKKISYYLDESNYDELEDLEAGISEMIGRGFSKE